MKLPNAENAIVDRAKIVGYLLSDTHPVGRHKAVVFQRYGFMPEWWQEMAAALKKHASDHEITIEEPSPFGKRFIIEGIMQVPDGRAPLVRTVWFLRTGETLPRFVTAYPLKR